MQGDFNRLSEELARQYHDRARLAFTFDEPLSHLIYAGCDMVLVPSMFEPCGLTQMIGMRYGTLSVVRKTGGLADTVFDVDHDEARAAEYGLQARASRMWLPCTCRYAADILCKCTRLCTISLLSLMLPCSALSWRSGSASLPDLCAECHEKTFCILQRRAAPLPGTPPFRFQRLRRAQVNGFNFEGTDPGGLDYALNRAVSTWYNDRALFRTLALRCMRTDWGWNTPAHEYIELYYKALKGFG